MLTAVSLTDRGDLRRWLVFGEPKEVREEGRRKDALFLPGRIVVYLVERARARALFVFRTPGGSSTAAANIAGVSPAVDLMLVTSTARSIRKITTALRFLSASPGLDVNTLSDGFWLRLADFVVARRSFRILPHVAQLLRAERTSI